MKTSWVDLVQVIVPVLTFALGGALTLMTEERRDRRAREREQARDRLAFQTNTLLELQEALYSLGLQTVALTKNMWEGEVVDALDERKRLKAFERAGLLRVRVSDAQVRDLAQQIRDQANAARAATTFEDAQSAVTRQGEMFQAVNHRIGQVLRGELDLIKNPT